MEENLFEKLNSLVIREKGFREDRKELNTMPSYTDYNRLLEALDKLIAEHRAEQKK